MSRLVALSIAAGLAGAPAVAEDPTPAPVVTAPPQTAPDGVEAEQAARKVVQCEGEKFVFAWGAGSNPTRVTLCGNKGATREETVAMLEEAAVKLEQSTTISEDRRIAIVQQIRGKIAEIKGGDAPKPAASTPIAASPARVPGVSPLKPIAPRPQASPPSQGATLASSALLLPKPKLSFECYTPGDIGAGGPCVSLNRETRLTVKAGEPIPAATSLRFTRNRNLRAEVTIGPLRKGQSKRLLIPRGVCGGVVETEIEVQVARGIHVVDTRGPYLMRC